MIARKSRWQLQEAKNKLSEVVRRTREEGPQTITVRGADAVVMVTAQAFAEYQRRLLGGPGDREESLSEFFQRWAKRTEGIELDLSQRLPEGPMREIDFGD
jgi:prevent-host-death family protein